MKTRIYCYLNDKVETELFSIYDVDGFSEPFKKGDEFWWSVSDLYPITISKLKMEFKDEFVNDISEHVQKKATLRGKYKIVSVYRSFEYDMNKINESDHYSLTIEYKVKKVKTHICFFKTYRFQKWLKSVNPFCKSK